MLADLAVPERLRGVLDGIWSFTGDGLSHRVLPDGCIDFLFDLDTGKAIVVGVMSRAHLVAPALGRRSYGIRFRPGQAAHFIAAHAAELLDRDGDFSTLTRLGELAERVAEAHTEEARRAATSSALLRADARTRPALARLDHALTMLRNTHGEISVTALAARSGWSERQLERCFLERVGIGPKRFARVVRFERALTLARDGRLSQAQVAAHAGYADEPHLLREFRVLAGLTPRALTNERNVGFVQGASTALGYCGEDETQKADHAAGR